MSIEKHNHENTGQSEKDGHHESPWVRHSPPVDPNKPRQLWTPHSRPEGTTDDETGDTPLEKLPWKRHARPEAQEKVLEWGLSEEERKKKEIERAAIVEEVRVMGIRTKEDLENAIRIITTKHAMTMEEALRLFHRNTLIPPMLESRTLHELLNEEKKKQGGMSRSK